MIYKGLKLGTEPSLMPQFSIITNMKNWTFVDILEKSPPKIMHEFNFVILEPTPSDIYSRTNKFFSFNPFNYIKVWFLMKFRLIENDISFSEVLKNETFFFDLLLKVLKYFVTAISNMHFHWYRNNHFVTLTTFQQKSMCCATIEDKLWF